MTRWDQVHTACENTGCNLNSGTIELRSQGNQTIDVKPTCYFIYSWKPRYGQTVLKSLFAFSTLEMTSTRVFFPSLLCVDYRVFLYTRYDLYRVFLYTLTAIYEELYYDSLEIGDLIQYQNLPRGSPVTLEIHLKNMRILFMKSFEMTNEINMPGNPMTSTMPGRYPYQIPLILI